jgi:hypothetical protein
MWNDPVVQETRRLREEYVAQFKGNLDAMHQDILRRQAAHKDRLVCFKPRSPRRRRNAA